jgi:hypothetical protein
LTGPELVQLIDRVFAPASEERRLAILVDLPDGARPDHSRWSSRRALAQSWVEELRRHAADRYSVDLYAYPNVGANNAELPERLWPIEGALPEDAAALEGLESVARDGVLAARPMVLAPTELSATAPLKLLGRRLGFRAATMGGFRTGMLPAMRLDLDEVDRRVRRLAALLDAAESARLELEVDGRIHGLFLDLRHRTAHASSGLLRQAGAVGNLPSGEAYIVPYEGERPEEPSRSRGVLPIQFGDQVALLEIEHNRVVHVEGGGEGGAEWAERIRREPATANIAELGLGVLAELGIEPIGSTLLDEKLGLHIALGRSDHFGGAVGPGDFSAPEQVVHQDFVYLPATQPRVHVRRVDLDTPAGPVAIIRDDRYVVDFGAES